MPNGFAVTADAYRYFLRESGVDRTLREVLEGLDTRDIDNLRQRGRRARDLILEAELPQDLQQAIVAAYEELSERSSHLIDVAVRSSATAEDLPDASFAGQQETYLNVQGEPALLETPASAASPRSSPIGRSLIASIRDSTTSRSAFRSACSAWCGRIWRFPASCSRSTPRPVSAMPS